MICFLAIFFAFSSAKAADSVGQLFVGVVYGKSLEEEQCAFLWRSRLGNVIYFTWANALESRQQVTELSWQLQQAITEITGEPPLIMVDQEGGRVARLREGFTAFNTNEVFGQLNDPQLVYQMGRTLARELRESGITVNLAPVVDVNVCPENKVIGSRSYGGDPKGVVRMASAFLRAHRQMGVGTALKHFPGHGDTRSDSHLELPVVDKPIEVLEATELAPFRALAAEADIIMTAHIYVPALDPEVPATFSSKILTGLLRQSIGFDGVIMSDSLVMRSAAPQQATFEQAVDAVTRAAKQAFLAGCDLLLLGALDWADCPISPEQNRQMQQRVIEGFSEAVRSGEIPQHRLEESLLRIKRLKKRFCVPVDQMAHVGDVVVEK